jgi:RimJ/RimL family protein N-acetyltransferase
LTDPPYRIETERLVLRCWDPAEAPKLAASVEASLDHLRPWMPWAHAYPQPLEDTVALLRGFRGRFDLGKDFAYGIFSPDESEVLGGTGLHPRGGEGSFEIGYWVRADESGRGLGTEATAALTRIAFELCGAERVDIRCDPANAASRAIPRKLGYTEEGTLRRRLHGPAGDPRRRDAVIYSMFEGELAQSPAASAEVRAFDALGTRLV